MEAQLLISDYAFKFVIVLVAHEFCLPRSMPVQSLAKFILSSDSIYMVNMKPK
jgi:hypothetical protein